MDVFVTFWGVRGSIPTPGFKTQRYGGNTACIEVRVGEKLFILDAGTGLRALGADLLKRGVSPVHAHMLFSHSHWDHIQGFPFFSLAYNPTTIMRVYGKREGEHEIYELLNGQMQDRYFPVQFSDLGAKILPDHLNGGSKMIGEVKVGYFETKHPGGSLAFSIECAGKKVVYSTDNELDLLLVNREETMADPSIYRHSPPAFVEFCRDANLLIADGQYTDEEYPKKIHWGHPRATTIVELAYAANIETVAITHHDPMQSDELVDKKIEACRTRAVKLSYSGVVFGAREGVTIKI
ncbi:MAG: MBL fold metallo-hydrolase [Myxococcota bacterium]|nr:MBL fold metallo-hydrolase [Myxococcota bacterium]